MNSFSASYLRREIFRSSTEGLHGGVWSNALLTKTKISDFDVAVFVQHQILQLQHNEIKYSSNLTPMIINKFQGTENGFNQQNITDTLICHFYTPTKIVILITTLLELLWTNRIHSLTTLPTRDVMRLHTLVPSCCPAVSEVCILT